MTIGNRVKEIRTSMSLNQSEFASRLGVISATISRIEKGNRNITEQMLLSICREFHVNEHWLRTGEGEMFTQPETFSLDEYAQKSQLSELELDIIKSYMDLNKDVRQAILKTAQQLFAKHSEIASTVEETNDDIEAELERYRQELEAEKKARMSLASQKQKKDLIG